MAITTVLERVKRVNGEFIDITIENGIIMNLNPSKVQSDEGNPTYVSSGWIDMHVHAFSKLIPYGDEIDEIGYKSGVTTIVDAGSTGSDNFNEFLKEIKKAKTNVLSFLNISRIGLKRIDELSDMSLLDQQLVLNTLANNKNIIVGLKARMSKSVVGRNELKPLKFARALSKKSGLPLMVHIGSGPPNINDIINLLEEKDIITHYLNGKENNLFTNGGKPIPSLLNAIKRNVYLDVGHGTKSFSFEAAKFAKEHGIEFDTISTDIYRDNRMNGPVYNMSHVLTKFLSLGYSLEKIIYAVTVNPAKWLGRPEMGRIQVGDLANLTIFSLDKDETILLDSSGIKENAKQHIKVRGVVINGEYFTC